MTNLSWNPVGSYTLVALVIGVLLVLLWFGPLRDKITRGRRVTLVALRLAIIALVALAMLRPALVYSRVMRQPSTLVMLLDSSRSMQVADTAGKRSRYEAMQVAVQDAWPRLRALSQDMQVKLFTFADEATPLALDEQPQWDEPPRGEHTAIGAVLEDVLRREAGQRLAGIVLVGDGAQQARPPRDIAPQIAARRLADMGYRFFAVPLGQDRSLGQTRDVAIEQLRSDSEVFVKNRLAIDAQGRFDGLMNQKLGVQLLFEKTPGKMEVVDAQQLQPTVEGQRVPLHFELTPDTPGEFKVTLLAPPQDGELVTTNNQMSTFITVRAGGLNVLYLEGVARVEQKFLRRALDYSPDIRVDYVRIDPRNKSTRPSDLLERFQPGKYNVILLGDLDARAFTSEEMQALAAMVERGAGLMLLGGLHSYGPGGYAPSPLAPLVPVAMDPLERQNFDEPIRRDVHLTVPTRLTPTRVGELQGFLRLESKADPAAMWSRLPPLDGANRFKSLKPGALALLESEQGDPLLVAKDYGLGRVLAFAGDSTWHWPMAGYVDPHRRFWRQVILWLARKDQSHEGRVWISLDQRRFSPGARVEFDLGAQAPEGDPITDATFAIEVVTPDGRKLSGRVQRQNEQQRGVFLESLTSGDYTIRVSATRGTTPLGVAQARFLIYDQDLELENPAADRGTLDALAKMTGGKLVAPEQLGELLDEIRDSLRQWEVTIEDKRTLWDTWPFFSVLIALLSGEWFLRKRWGLV